MNIPLQTRVLPQTSAPVPRTTMKNFIAQARTFWVYVQNPCLDQMHNKSIISWKH